VRSANVDEEVTVALSDRNARRSDEAERARHLSATESVAFATMLLGLLNDADAVLHRWEHDVPSSAPDHRGAALAPPAEAAPAGLAPADHEPVHRDQHAGAVDTPAADASPTIHADAAAAIQPQTVSEAVDAAPSVNAHAFAASPELSSFSTLGASTDHASSQNAGTGHVGAIASPSLDLGASIHNLLDGVTGIIDTSLAAVSGTIASLSATVGQLTSTVTDTVSHLVGGLTGAVTGLLHDAPTTGLLDPPADFSGLTSSAGTTDFSGAAHHDGSLLDTAGAIPTSLLHPIPLQLGFLGQPTIDGHEPHDGAFSTLGGHHF
jgi:hypothetical protein